MSVKKVVGDYELGRTLGEGTFGKVKFARHVTTNEAVAIKIIDQAMVRKDDLREVIKREIATMKAARHPCVVELKQVLATRDKIYIVLQLVTGGELFDVVYTNGRLTEDVARRHFQRLVDGVEFCHSKGVFHRDLKPENLLLDESGNLLISDFGLSALAENQEANGMLQTACGTPNYVAPEVTTGKGYDGGKADIWSCGVILFMLVSGKLPFDRPNLPELFKQIRAADYSSPKHFSAGLKGLLGKVLVADPERRASFEDIRGDEWFRERYTPVEPPNPGAAGDGDAGVGGLERQGTLGERVELRTIKTKEKPRRPRTLNAFEIINLTACDMSDMFEKREDIVSRNTRFSCWSDPGALSGSVAKAAEGMGFEVQARQDKLRLVHKAGGALVITVEVFEIIPGLALADFRRTSGDRKRFASAYSEIAQRFKPA
mmetsp:Transcript_16702/g.56981  ORF Transcript_16702/g.56981 Transcript_16702/m.56981 type:complete len:431 (+) Transcript_16702:105-1397(+)